MLKQLHAWVCVIRVTRLIDCLTSQTTACSNIRNNKHLTPENSCKEVFLIKRNEHDMNCDFRVAGESGGLWV